MKWLNIKTQGDELLQEEWTFIKILFVALIITTARWDTVHLSLRRCLKQIISIWCFELSLGLGVVNGGTVVFFMERTGTPINK